MARYGGGFGGFGGNNMQALMKQAQKMQEDALKAKEEVENSEHEGKASGGLVTVVVNGNGVLKKIHIDPQIVDPDDTELLEDMITAAYNAANEKAKAFKDSKMGNLGGLM